MSDEHLNDPRWNCIYKCGFCKCYDAEVKMLRAALEKIRAYEPGQFRGLKDEIAIYDIAGAALMKPDAPP